MQTGATRRPRINQRHVPAELRRANGCHVPTWASAQHQLLWILHQRLKTPKKRACHRAIDQTMVEREGQRHHWPRYNLALLHNRLFLQPAYREDRHFRMIDDGGAAAAAETAHIIQSERAPAQFAWKQGALTGALKEPFKLSSNGHEGEPVCIAQHRHKQALWSCRCQPNVV